MKACFRVGRNQEGLALFDRMRKYRPDPPRGDKGALASSSSCSSSPSSPSPESSSRAQRPPPFSKILLRNGAGVIPGAGATAGTAAVPAGRGKYQELVPAVTAAAGRGKRKSGGKERAEGGGGGGGGGGGVFRASSPPRPDTASYNTVIAAVASSWGWEGRVQAMALVDEMRVRGFGSYTVEGG